MNRHLSFLNKQALTLLFIHGFLSANLVLAQGLAAPQITIQYEDRPLRVVLQSLEAHFQIQFSYLEHNITGKTITASLERESLTGALGRTLRGTGLGYRIFNSHDIALFRRQADRTATIRGRITDRATGSPIPFAHVLVPSLGIGDAADSEGFFDLAGLVPDTYELRVAVIGYADVTRTIIARDTTILDVALEIEVIELGEVDVTPGIYQIHAEEPSSFVLSAEEILSSPNILKDAFRGIHGLPGVADNETSAKARIKGGHPDETSIIFDDMVLFEPFHTEDLDGVFGMINADIVKQVKVATGGFSARYPDKMSGIVDVKTIDRIKDHSISMSLDFLNASFISQQKISNRINHFLAARRGLFDLVQSDRDFFPAYVDLWKENTDFQIDFKNRIKPSYWDIWSKLDYRINPSSNFSLNILSAGDKFEYVDELATTKGEYFFSTRANFYGWMNWQSMLMRNWRASTTLGIQRLHKRAHFFLEQSQVDDNKDDKDIKILSLRHSSSWQASRSHLLQFGFELYGFRSDYYFDEIRLNRIQTDADRVVIDTLLVDSDFDGSTLSLFFQDTWQISKQWDFQLGLRLSDQSYVKGLQLAPRTALRYRLGPHLTAKLAYGWYYQPDNFYQLKTYQGQSEPLAKTEKSIHHIGELSYQDRMTLFSIGAYYKAYVHLSDDFGFDFVNRYERGIIDSPFMAARGHSSGIDVFLRRGRAESNLISLSYSYGRHRIEDMQGIQVARDFDRTHSLTLRTILRFGRQTTFSVQWRHHTGDPFTSSVARISGDSTLSGSKIYFEIGEKNGARLPSYHSVDLKFEKRWQIGPVSLASYINVINLMDRENVKSFDWESNGVRSVEMNRITYLLPARRTLSGRTGSLGIALAF